MAVINKEEMIKLFKEGFIQKAQYRCTNCNDGLFNKYEYAIYWHTHTWKFYCQDCALDLGKNLIIDYGVCRQKNKQADRI